MTNYRTGSAVERKAKKFLEGAGYNVLRSAGSKGAFDLVAYNNVVVRLIQCKTFNTPREYESDLSRMRMSIVPGFCYRELWTHQNRVGWHQFLQIDHGVPLEYPQSKFGVVNV